MRWMGRGPYRVWKNRIAGTRYGIWQKDYNNTITGESYENLIYPEFKGYHAHLFLLPARHPRYRFVQAHQAAGAEQPAGQHPHQERRRRPAHRPDVRLPAAEIAACRGGRYRKYHLRSPVHHGGRGCCVCRQAFYGGGSCENIEQRYFYGGGSYENSVRRYFHCGGSRENSVRRHFYRGESYENSVRRHFYRGGSRENSVQGYFHRLRRPAESCWRPSEALRPRAAPRKPAIFAPP